MTEELKSVQHHKECITREELGCFYYCCVKCAFYMTKDSNGVAQYHLWDDEKRCHIKVSEKVWNKGWKKYQN